MTQEPEYKHVSVGLGFTVSREHKFMVPVYAKHPLGWLHGPAYALGDWLSWLGERIKDWSWTIRKGPQIGEEELEWPRISNPPAKISRVWLSTSSAPVEVGDLVYSVGPDEVRAAPKPQSSPL